MLHDVFLKQWKPVPTVCQLSPAISQVIATRSLASKELGEPPGPNRGVSPGPARLVTLSNALESVTRRGQGGGKVSPWLRGVGRFRKVSP